jgi:hypothetical protein
MEVDRLVPDYSRVGGPSDKLVLIESSVGVTPDKIIQSNKWMLQTAAADKKILAVVGNLDVTQLTSTFVQQLDALAGDKNFVGLRIGSGIFAAGVPRTFATILPNVINNLRLMVQRGMMIDTLGIAGSVLSDIGAATGITIVMDHFAGKPTTFLVEDAGDMQDASRCQPEYQNRTFTSQRHLVTATCRLNAVPADFQRRTLRRYTSVSVENFGPDRSF